VGSKLLESLVGILGQQHLVALAKAPAQLVPDPRIVVDNQQFFHE